MLDEVKSKFNIVMLTTDRKIDRRILLQSESLKNAGHQVIILALMPDQKVIQDDSILYLASSIVKSGSHKLFFATKIANWIKKITSQMPFIQKTLRGLFWSKLANPETLYHSLFIKPALAQKADIYVAHDLPILPVAYYCANEIGAKLIYDSHELYTEQGFLMSEKQVWQGLETKYIQFCDSIMTVNESIANELKQRYDLKNVHVIHNADKIVDPLVNNRLFHQFFSLDPNVKILLYQGSLLPERNIEALILAMTLIKNTDLHLVFLGDGPLLNKAKNLVTKNDMGGKIHFHPVVEQEKLLKYTASADIGVIPYQPSCLNNRLCTPNKLFEFIAAGIPIIASDLPELRKIISNNNIGVVGDTSTPEAFAKILENMSQNEVIQKHKEAVLQTRNRINWQQESKKFLMIYDSLRH